MLLLSVVDCGSHTVSQNQGPLNRLPRASCYFSEESKRLGVCTAVIPDPFPLLSCMVSSCISYCLCCCGPIPGMKQVKVGNVALLVFQGRQPVMTGKAWWQDGPCSQLSRSR